MVSNVPWTAGKGVIGACWDHGRAEYVHWAPLAKRWHRKDVNDKQWAGISEKDRAGFSRAEFIEMVGKYAEIRAVPIKDAQGNVLGVLAVDRVWTPEGSAGRLLDTRAVEETLTSAAIILHTVLAGR